MDDYDYQSGYHWGKEWYERSQKEGASLYFGRDTNRSVEWMKGFSDGFKSAKKSRNKVVRLVVK